LACVVELEKVNEKIKEEEERERERKMEAKKLVYNKVNCIYLFMSKIAGFNFLCSCQLAL
jgi:hypothetical protein